MALDSTRRGWAQPQRPTDVSSPMPTPQATQHPGDAVPTASPDMQVPVDGMPGTQDKPMAAMDSVMAAIKALAPKSGYARQPRLSPMYRWWKPILTVIVTAVVYILTYALGMGIAVNTGFMTLGDFDRMANSPSGYDNGTEMFLTPEGAVFTIGGLAIIILMLAIGLAVTRERPLGTVTSVAGRFRLRYYAMGILFGVLTVGTTATLEWVVSGCPRLHVMHVEPTVYAILAVALPLQCMAEEYMFRGYAMQTTASWLPRKIGFIAGLIVQSGLFMAAHPYNLAGQLTILATAVSFGWLTERTGGLEASSGFHFANNAVAFTTVIVGSDVFTSNIPVVTASIDVIFTLLGPVLMILVANRLGWLDDEETQALGHAPGRLFQSQYDRLMWQQIQEHQAQEWQEINGDIGLDGFVPVDAQAPMVASTGTYVPMVPYATEAAAEPMPGYQPQSPVSPEAPPAVMPPTAPPAPAYQSEPDCQPYPPDLVQPVTGVGPNGIILAPPTQNPPATDQAAPVVENTSETGKILAEQVFKNLLGDEDDTDQLAGQA